MWSRLSPFLILGLMATAGPVQACMADNDVDAAAGLSFPSSGHVFQFAHLPAQARGFVRMKLLTAGDRWEIAETGEVGPLAWRAVHGGEGLKLWMWGKAEGQVEIPPSLCPRERHPPPCSRRCQDYPALAAARTAAADGGQRDLYRNRRLSSAL